MFTTGSLPLALRQEWQQKISEWAADGSLGAAAQAAFRLEGRPAALAALISQWAAGDFSALPPIVLLPASSMPGAAGAYAISTGTIYLNQHWLAGASEAQAMAVLTEELGHYLDGLLNVVDTPGDEGELFADLVRGVGVSEGKLRRIKGEDDSAIVMIDGQTFQIEQASHTSTIGLVKGNYSLNASLVSYEYFQSNYSFQMSRAGGTGDYISVSSNSRNGDLVLILFDEGNNEISTANINKLLSPNNYESISLNGLPAGNYKILVYDFWGGLFNPDDPSGLPIVKYLPYNLTINALTTGTDRFESNNTSSTAKNLGLVSGLRQENDLSIDTKIDQDWYKFEISGQTTDRHYLSIDFTNSLGDLDIILYNEQEQLISSSNGVTDSETISLSGLKQGFYYL